MALASQRCDETTMTKHKLVWCGRLVSVQSTKELARAVHSSHCASVPIAEQVRSLSISELSRE